MVTEVPVDTRMKFNTIAKELGYRPMWLLNKLVEEFIEHHERGRLND